MANKLYRELMVGDQFKYDNGIWIKTAPKKKGCCGSPLLYNAHLLGNTGKNKIFKPDESLEIYKENVTMAAKKTTTISKDITSRSDKLKFSSLSVDDYFVFSNGSTVYKKVDGGTSIDEDGRVVRLRPQTSVFHLYNYGKEDASAQAKEPKAEPAPKPEPKKVEEKEIEQTK